MRKAKIKSIAWCLVWGLLMVVVGGCSITTPEIRGLVLDEETKQPVEGAWVTATMTVRTKTIAGDVTTYLSIDDPHTRTDKSGKFTIHSKNFKKPSFPYGFGTDVINFSLAVNTIDDKGNSINLMDFLRKDTKDVIIFIKPEYVKYTEGEYLAHLAALYNYCLMGNFAGEVTPVKGGCDSWELDYVIAKHERYLVRYWNILEERGYSNALDQLAYLYEIKGDYEKAIKNYQKSIVLMEKRGLIKYEVWQIDKKNYERKIDNLLQKLQGKGK